MPLKLPRIAPEMSKRHVSKRDVALLAATAIGLGMASPALAL